MQYVDIDYDEQEESTSTLTALRAGFVIGDEIEPESLR